MKINSLYLQACFSTEPKSIIVAVILYFLFPWWKRNKKSRKFDRPPRGLQLLREFSSSPRRKNVLAKETPELIKIRHSISITRCSERGVSAGNWFTRRSLRPSRFVSSRMPEFQTVGAYSVPPKADEIRFQLRNTFSNQNDGFFLVAFVQK